MDLMERAQSSAFFAPARSDFSEAIRRNPKHALAFDRRGLVAQSTGDWEQAIADYQQEATLDPGARYRVADAYCNRGGSYLREKKYDPAIADFNKAIEIGGPSDPCQCEPYNPLLAIYLNQTREFDMARAVVARAQRAGKWVAPEYLEQLKAASPIR